MSQKLWDIGRTSVETLEDKWRDNGVYKEKVQEHGEKFEDRFAQNHVKDIPTHPYKIYRRIVEENELSDEEKVALEHLKDKYADMWKAKKRRRSS